jgi:hypothetical protein
LYLGNSKFHAIYRIRADVGGKENRKCDELHPSQHTECLL